MVANRLQPQPVPVLPSGIRLAGQALQQAIAPAVVAMLCAAAMLCDGIAWVVFGQLGEYQRVCDDVNNVCVQPTPQHVPPQTYQNCSIKVVLHDEPTSWSC